MRNHIGYTVTLFSVKLGLLLKASLPSLELDTTYMQYGVNICYCWRNDLNNVIASLIQYLLIELVWAIEFIHKVWHHTRIYAIAILSGFSYVANCNCNCKFLDRGMGPVHPNHIHYKSYIILLKCLSSRFLKKNWIVEVASIAGWGRNSKC